MSYPLSEIHASFLQGRILPAPSHSPSEKGFLGIFNHEMEPNIMELVNPMQVILQEYSQMGNLLSGYFDRPNEFFSISSKQLKAIVQDSKIAVFGDNQFIEGVNRLLNAGWISGEKWLASRFVIMLAGYMSEQIVANWRDTFKGLQDDLIKESILLLLMGMARRDSIHYALNLAVRGSLFLDLSQDEKAWLFDLIEKESDYNFNNTLAKVSSLYMEFVKDCQLSNTERNNRGINEIQLEEFKCYAQITQLTKNELMTLSLLLRSINKNPTELHCLSIPTKKLLVQIEDKMILSENEMAEQLLICNRSKFSILKPEKMIQYIKDNAGKKVLEKSLFMAFWDMFFYCTLQPSNKSIEQPLRKQTALQLAASGEAFSWESLLWTGFWQVPIPKNHSPYFGLHPDQIRPLFQLMRAVADVDIVKIYKVGKLYHVHFIFGQEMYDMPTGDGFGVGPLPHFNTLLFNTGVPYQIVVVEVPLFDPQLNSIYKTKVVTLVNQETYDRFESRILPQGLVGFAATSDRVPPFTKNIDELSAIKKNKTDLDVMKLGDDPKFMGITEQLEKLEPVKVWMKLLRHSLIYPLDGKPSATWQAEAKKIVSEMPADQFKKGLVMVIDGMIKSDEWFSDDEKICGLRGLIWLCRLNMDDSLRYLLQRTANKAYKKLPGGPLNAKLGNLALDGLAADDSLQAFGVLGNLKARAKYPVLIRAIDSAMKKFDKLLKQYPEDELQDRVIPNHDLENGRRTIPVGNYEARLKIEGLKVKVDWLSANGKTITSVPGELKREYEVELQRIKGEVKGIQETIQAQLARLEKSWLQNRSWPLTIWQEYYRSHELMGLLVQKLIWQVESEGKVISFMPAVDMSFDQNWQPIELPKSGQIRLWHPALASSVAEVEAWRNLFFERKIVQPFKQAFREVYLLTPAEKASFDHSLRFAGHILNGNMLYSLGKNRMWTMSYDQPPLRKIPALNIVAELSITGGVLYSNCTTGALCFWELASETNNNNIFRQTKLPLKDVPPTLLSEVMRDIDLFVAVSSICIDPYFDQNNSGDLLQYWQDVSFGLKSKTEIADIRHDLLKRLLPMTKIASQCRLNGNNLHVKGKIREYKINLNSGNILMLPNDQYLCIVPGHFTHQDKRIWLPFEGGDSILMMVIAKAFLLAEDDKITDLRILGQQRR